MADPSNRFRSSMERALLVQRQHPDAVMPRRGTPEAAGLDLSALYDVEVIPSHIAIGQGKSPVITVQTGIHVAIPEGCYGRVAPRSGLALRHGFDVLAGVVDRDYRGEILVLLVNHGLHLVHLAKGDRVAQLILEKYESSPIVEIAADASLPSSKRGEGGFGSTGV